MTFLSRGREGSQFVHKKQTKIWNSKRQKNCKPKCLCTITKNFNWKILTKYLVLRDRMGLKMKKVNIMGVHQFLGQGRGGGHKKTIYNYGELPKKGSLNNLQGTWQKIGRRVFLRRNDTLMHTMT